MRNTILRPEMFGAVADCDPITGTGTDNTAALARMADYVNTYGGHVIVDGPLRYTMAPALFRGTVEWVGEGWFHNSFVKVSDADYWRQTGLFVGSHFGYNKVESVQGEPAWAIQDAFDGQTYVDVVDPAVMAELSVGDRVVLTGGEYQPNVSGTSGIYYKGSHATTVRAIAGQRVELRHRLSQDLLTGPDAPTLRRDSGLVLPSAMPGTPRVTQFARGVRLINATITCAALDAQVVHASTWGCELDFRYLKGGCPFVANPMIDTTLTVREAHYAWRALEIAYHHHRIDMPMFHAARYDRWSGTASPALSVGEWGSRARFGHITIEDEDWDTDKNVPGASLLSRGLEIDTLRVTGSQGAAVSIGKNSSWAQGTRIKRLVVEHPASSSHGVVVDSPDIWVGSMDVRGVHPTKKALWVKAGAGFHYNHANFNGGVVAYD